MKCKTCKINKLKYGQTKYCSMVCTYVGRHYMENARKHKKYGKCTNCKIKFKKDRPKNLFCSRKCYWESSYISKQSKNTQRERLKKGTHNLYISGLTPKNEKIRRSAKYKKWRKEVFTRDKYTCQECGQIGGVLNADHIKPFILFPQLRFEITNGRTLCRSCHLKTDTWGTKARNFKEDDSQIQSLLIVKNKDIKNPRIEIQL